MVLNPEDLRKPMSGFDWELFGHQYRKNDLPTLPSYRIDMPLPCRLEQGHTLAHKLAALSQQIGTEIRLAQTNRQGLLSIKHLINQFRKDFAMLKKEWEMELRETEAESKISASSGERLRAVK